MATKFDSAASLTSNQMNSRPNHGRNDKRKFLVAFTVLFTIGASMKTWPFLTVLPIPSVLKSNGVILSLVLIILVALKSRLRFLELRGSRRYLPFVLYAAIDTAVMSLILFQPLGTLYGDTTISASAPAYLWLAMMAVDLMALDYCFRVIGTSGLDIVFEAYTVTTILVGCVQACSVLATVSLYDAFNFLGLFQEIFNDRISTIGSEPSSNGMIICMIALPYVASKIKQGSHWRFTLYAVLLIILIFFVSSSQCYMAFIGFLVAYLVIYRDSRIGRGALVAFCCIGLALCCAVLVITANYSDFMSSEPVQQLRYYLFEKITDQSNGSTVNRFSTLINDIFVFLQFPIFGCGEGMQGFFFNSNIAAHGIMGNSQELSNLLSGASGVVGPGCFITAILSSFGVVGFVLFAWGLVANLREARRSKRKMNGYYEMTMMSLAAALPMGFIGMSFAGSWLLYVILALPFLATHHLDKRLESK